MVGMRAKVLAYTVFQSLCLAYINYLLVSKALERIADLCTNIAEDIIYMKRSLIVRHNLDDAIERIKSEYE